jgi:murein DD-endopeptidase MepM/ murein hydrolase activator NlpD
MKTFTPHIARGEHTRALLYLLVSAAALAVALAVTPAPRAVAGGSGYPWPLKPFDQPHPIRGSFGDPRTVFTAPPTPNGLMTGGGKFNFHFGVDIWARNGTPVFPVRSGTVTVVSTVEPREYVEVYTGGGQSFQYWHIKPAVHVGQRVEAGKTRLGAIVAPYEHVHFAELEGGRVVNPLAPGHLSPYVDTTRPEVESITLRSGDTGPSVVPTFVSGRVLMIAEAYDTRQLPIPGVWQPMPVAPARVAWQLRGLGGKTFARGVAADFRWSLPSNGAFWSYYARGTYQNMSVFGSRYSWGQPGCFLFKLTHSAFDTRSVSDGVYDLVVAVADIAGNASSKSLRLTIDNHRGKQR